MPTTSKPGPADGIGAEQRHAEVCTLLDQALDLPAGKRMVFLAEIGHRDPMLEKEVRSLLDEVTGEGEDPSAPKIDFEKVVHRGMAELRPSVDIRGLRPAMPERIGPYEIRQLIGEGGMGAVYLAEQQQPVRRTVALKVIHSSLRTPMALARFEAERNALARLDHPNVAHLYEAGTTHDGFPYFAMEHVVGGEAITAYCDQECLSLDARLRLFVQVCDGVRHAHQKGVLHRDIKPANVLVAPPEEALAKTDSRAAIHARAGSAIPKVIDFGLAKAIDDLPLIDITQLTGGRAVGTPAYMSPEAREGSSDLDTRADVYSLGILLFELVSGLEPHRFRTSATGRPSAKLSQHDPASWDRIASRRQMRPEDLAQRLRGDLDWIAAKAIDEDIERRYASAAELAADLERHLAGEPVHARPPSLAYIGSRVLRRHWRFVLAAALLVLALIGGFVARTLEADRANAEATRARQEADRARRALADARELSAFLVGLFETADPERDRNHEVTALELLERSTSDLTEGLEGQPLTRARFLTTIGRIYTNMGRYAEAGPVLERAIELYESNAGADDYDLAEARGEWGVFLRRAARYEEAERALRGALSSHCRGDAERLAECAQAHRNLGNLFYSTARPQAAEEMHREALRLQREHASAPGVIGETYHNLATALVEQGRLDEARVYQGQAIDLISRGRGEQHPRTLAAIYGLAILERQANRWDRAEECLIRVFEGWSEAYGPDHERTVRARRSLVNHYSGLHRWPEAIELVRARLDRIAGPGNAGEGTEESRVWHRKLGLLLARSGELAEAEEHLKRALELGLALDGPDHDRTLIDRTNLAWIDWQKGRLDAAEAELDAILGRRSELGWDDDGRMSWLWHHRGLIRAEKGQARGAEEDLRRAIAARKEMGPARRNFLAESELAFGRWLVSVDRAEEGRRHLQTAVELLEGIYPEGHPERVEARAALDAAQPR